MSDINMTGIYIGLVIGTIVFFIGKWVFIDRKKVTEDLLSQTQEVGSQWDHLKKDDKSI